MCGHHRRWVGGVLSPYAAAPRERSGHPAVRLGHRRWAFFSRLLRDRDGSRPCGRPRSGSWREPSAGIHPSPGDSAGETDIPGRGDEIGNGPGIPWSGSAGGRCGEWNAAAPGYTDGADPGTESGHRADSTMVPAYITATRRHMRLTTPGRGRSTTRRSPGPPPVARAAGRICAWIVTSRAVVGSSARRRRGEPASAIASSTRCRIPPLIRADSSRDALPVGDVDLAKQFQGDSSHLGDFAPGPDPSHRQIGRPSHACASVRQDHIHQLLPDREDRIQVRHGILEHHGDARPAQSAHLLILFCSSSRPRRGCGLSPPRLAASQQSDDRWAVTDFPQPLSRRVQAVPASRENDTLPAPSPSLER